MEALDAIKNCMSRWRWSNGGQPGSVKTDEVGNIIARQGDAAWVRDVEDAIEFCNRQRVIAELERRDRERRSTALGG